MSIIVLGAGGHAKVVIDALQASGAKILCITDPDTKTHGKSVLGVPIFGPDDVVFEHKRDDTKLVNGIGTTRVSDHRKNIFDRFVKAGYSFQSVIHPSAIIGAEVEISDGVQIMAGSVLQAACRIGANTIINTRASVDHDCIIWAHAHIAPGVVLGGGVHIGDGAHIGTGAVVLQNIKIGDNALVAAGATVISNVAPGGRVAGTAARNM